ncbi:MAG: putative V-type synthase subunit [Chlamydiota bacterium]|jgi:V/A-type H+-transporting ATPase subunit E
MKQSETGQDKVKRICDLLKKETLEPALREAEEIVAAAREKAEEIVAKAGRDAEKIILEAQEEIAREKNVFQASLGQACKQSISALKQEIEQKIFGEGLTLLLKKKMQEPKVLSDLITAVVKAIEKEGTSGSLSAFIPAEVPAREVNELLGSAFLEKLKEKSVLIGPSSGGIEIVLHGSHVRIELTDKTLKDLVANYIRKDFREMVLK